MLLWIFLGICLFIGILLSFSLTVYVKITDEIRLHVGAFGYKKQVSMNKSDKEKKPHKSKKAPNKIKKKKSDKPENPKKSTEKSFFETIEFAVMLIKSIAPNSISMLKHIRITSLLLYMTVAEEQADKTAVSYGAISGGIYNLLGILDNTFKLKIKAVDIVPDFVTGEAEYNISFKTKLRFYHIIFALFGILFKFIGNTLKNIYSTNQNKNINKAVRANERTSSTGHDGNNNGKNQRDDRR